MIKLTEEEKTRWKPMLLRTWDSIAYDVIQACGGNCSGSEAREMTLDAGRPCDYGMTKEEYLVLCRLPRSTVEKWVREFMRGPYCI